MPSVQIGQIMLVMPNAFSKMGFSAAFPLAIVMGFMSVYTCYLLVALYCERKARLVSRRQPTHQEHLLAFHICQPFPSNES